MSKVVCNSCGKAFAYDKYQHKDPTNFICVDCRNEAVEKKDTSKGYFCINKNANNENKQSCWTCTEPVATHFVKFTYTIDGNEQEYWIYTCQECYKKYGKLNGRMFNLDKEPNFVHYAQAVQLEYLLQFCK